MQKTKVLGWGRNTIAYMVSQKYLGHTAAMIAEFSEEAPRRLIAMGLLDIRRRCRVMVERAKRGHAKAQARSRA